MAVRSRNTQTFQLLRAQLIQAKCSMIHEEFRGKGASDCFYLAGDLSSLALLSFIRTLVLCLLKLILLLQPVSYKEMRFFVI